MSYDKIQFPFDYTAKDLAIKASGGSIGPEIDAYSQGKYYHYHLIGRIGGHSFILWITIWRSILK